MESLSLSLEQIQLMLLERGFQLGARTTHRKLPGYRYGIFRDEPWGEAVGTLINQGSSWKIVTYVGSNTKLETLL